MVPNPKHRLSEQKAQYERNNPAFRDKSEPAEASSRSEIPVARLAIELNQAQDRLRRAIERRDEVRKREAEGKARRRAEEQERLQAEEEARRREKEAAETRRVEEERRLAEEKRRAEEEQRHTEEEQRHTEEEQRHTEKPAEPNTLRAMLDRIARARDHVPPFVTDPPTAVKLISPPSSLKYHFPVDLTKKEPPRDLLKPAARVTEFSAVPLSGNAIWPRKDQYDIEVSQAEDEVRRLEAFLQAATEETRRREAEATRLKEETLARQRAENAHQQFTRHQRRANRQCVLCGKALGVLARALCRERHFGCKTFKG